MRLDDPVAHLGYCTNIHPAQSWSECWAQLREHLPAVKRLACPTAPMGVGLRLSAQAASELLAGALDPFADWLSSEGLYVFTINGFVHGTFHGETVKQSVYHPDWGHPARLAYTRDLVTIGARLSRGEPVSLSTVPLGFGDPGGRSSPEAMRDQLLAIACDLWRAADRDGLQLQLALEPEPLCMLETIEQTVDFFQSTLWSPEALARFGHMTGLAAGAAERALRRHVGVCLDTCHAAVEFEDPLRCVEALLDAGIAIPKVQVTTGLEVDPTRPGALDALEAFADDVYLHQVIIDHGSSLERQLDLPVALARARTGAPLGRRWRVHFHVPVFAAHIPPFSNTQPFLRQCLLHVRDRSASAHLEVETYTWDVLPAEHRTQDVDRAIARELSWVAEVWNR